MMLTDRSISEYRCDCGGLPAAASLCKQEGKNGATTAFLISTSESGLDSISVTYALLDPIMAVASLLLRLLPLPSLV